MVAHGGSVAARMLARKQNLLNSQQDMPGAREHSNEAHKVTSSKETRKLTNRGNENITSSRNLKSQFSNKSIESEGRNFVNNAVSEFKPMPNFG